MKIQVTNPAKIEFTLTVTYDLETWKRLRDQMKDGQWPSNEITNAIRDMVNQAEKSFYPKPESTNDN